MMISSCQRTLMKTPTRVRLEAQILMTHYQTLLVSRLPQNLCPPACVLACLCVFVRVYSSIYLLESAPCYQDL